jgi:hypothetical protein
VEVLGAGPLASSLEQLDPQRLDVVPGAVVFPHAHQVGCGDALVIAAADTPGGGERVARALGGAGQVEPAQEVAAVDLRDEQSVAELVDLAERDRAVEQDSRLLDPADRVAQLRLVGQRPGQDAGKLERLRELERAFERLTGLEHAPG